MLVLVRCLTGSEESQLLLELVGHFLHHQEDVIPLCLFRNAVRSERESKDSSRVVPGLERPGGLLDGWRTGNCPTAAPGWMDNVTL